jgi:hypothetical protein
MDAWMHGPATRPGFFLTVDPGLSSSNSHFNFLATKIHEVTQRRKDKNTSSQKTVDD